MIIKNLKTNRITNPMGFDLGSPRVSWITESSIAKKQKAAQIQVAMDIEFNQIILDTGISSDIDSISYELKIDLKPQTRYYWKVTVWADNGEVATSEIAWFETAKLDKPWKAKWVTPEFAANINPVIYKTVSFDKEVESVRVYMTGLGLYELYVNKSKVGNEYLTPNFNAYDRWIQYQTYDITENIQWDQNLIEIALGDGWYKGRVFGFDSNPINTYGDKFVALAEILVHYADGTYETIITDNTWKARYSNITISSIYDGEVYDATLDTSEAFSVIEVDYGYEKLKARLSLPVKMKEEIKPIDIIYTPAGETVLDFGQNMVGWVSFSTTAPKGTVIKLSHGEILQRGNFYRENLRSAKAEYTYISEGEQIKTRPHFTYYGFRYVKVEGWYGEISLDYFVGHVVYSDMELTGHIETNNEKINRLFLNVLWGQKGNFLDVPTDCPQRDERQGWTGDAQVFSGTASFNMDTAAFFQKYGYDIAAEQRKFGGSVPYVVPTNGFNMHGSTAWGEAATVIPWNVYLYFGDKAILENQLSSMKAWVDYIKNIDDANGSTRLWVINNHFGDWLSLDAPEPSIMTGGTDTGYIASAYYCYSSELVAKAATVLGKENMAKEYSELAAEIRKAIQDEYFSKNGRLTVDTQTGYVLALFLNLVPEGYTEKAVNGLVKKLKESKYHLKTGFVGTPYLCLVLSKYGRNDLAYRLLLNEDYPSWLYAVNLGATTIWERWNSVLEDGSISDTGMNSLNHYAYGSIVEWMYRYMVGFNPVEGKPGFRHIQFTAMPEEKFKWVKGIYSSPAGTYESAWSYDENRKLTIKLVVPFNTSATVVLPDADLNTVKVNGGMLKDVYPNAIVQGGNISFEVESGTYEFMYKQERTRGKNYHIEMDVKTLLADDEAKKIILEYMPELNYMPEFLLDGSLEEIMLTPFSKSNFVVLRKLDAKLRTIGKPESIMK
ncbi:alpha-L-rhamnosidase [Niallia nealsonii]|nr:alpha-L-rhamnosidase [Niallia nealsonii]